MTTWDTYPADYRAAEVRAIVAAVQAGECVSIVGLSGAGKSNLLGFVAHHQSAPGCRCVLVDCNRLPEPTAPALFDLIRHALGDGDPASTAGDAGSFAALDAALERHFAAPGSLSLLLDRFDTLALADTALRPLFNNLRALRDAYKFRLTYVTATRRPLPAHNELAELFHANTLWLGPLSASDARWNVARYAGRKGLDWDDAVATALVQATWGYPALLRAACEAYAAGAGVQRLATHPAVQARVAEFWSDHPTDEELRRSGLAGQPLLDAGGARPVSFDTSQLTAKEHRLLNYFRAHPDTVCEKDDLIRAVWPEDRVYARGVRDDSLAQLVRRLREKIEPDAAQPRLIQTVPGRGYRFRPGPE